MAPPLPAPHLPDAPAPVLLAALRTITRLGSQLGTPFLLYFGARFRGISSEELFLFAQGTYQPPLTEFFSSLSVPLSHTVPSM